MVPKSNDHKLMDYWDKKSAQELERERIYPPKKVHTDLIWREINRSIGSLNNLRILDAGGGSGRFSIPLAQDGHEVIHLDISSEMIDIAKDKAAKLRCTNIKFYQSDICEKLNFPNNSFDLVLCLDSPLSFCHSDYESVLNELVRVTKSDIILCVMNRTGVIFEDGGNTDLIHFGKLKTIWDVWRTGTLIVDEELKNLAEKVFDSVEPQWREIIKDARSKPKSIREIFDIKI